MNTMDSLETWLAFRDGECGDLAPHECDECGVVSPDVDLDGELIDTGEQVWLCPDRKEQIG